ncbi:hypothetical protein ACHAXT_005268 [Thalassiosira profunda]
MGDVGAEARDMYTPLERDWLSGKNQSFRPYVVSGSPACKLHEDAPLMYTTRLGHQCGCGVRGFRPSHSVWTHGNRNSTTNSPAGNHAFDSPSLRLVDKLARANQTLCFFGDSIDLQIYDALRHNIERIVMLQHNVRDISPNPVKISIFSTEIPVEYTDETGPSWYGKNGFRYLNDISETTISLERDGERISSSFNWIKSYGWAPGHTSFTDHCSIIVANLGLHYSVRSGELTQSFTNATLGADLHAAITFLADFASSGGDKIAIWRSALPQHFQTDDGHHEEGKECSLVPRKPADGGVIQKYNAIYEETFARICNAQLSSGCNAYEHSCSVNVKSVEHPTLYRYYKENTCCREHLERLEKGDASVTGTILRWQIADLFDVPQWHVASNDCSHFCFVPALYEAAFERLELLLPSS